jgi:predicted alpha/beta superfamily hydrolase
MRFPKSLPAFRLFLFLFLLPAGLHAQDRFQQAVHIGQVDSIWSATLEENRPYLVYTPPSYGDTTAAPQRYPVLYLLDGDAHFHSVSGLLQILGTGVNGTYVVPEMIVVAIPNTNRTRDLTPTHTEMGFEGEPEPEFESSGGGPAFLAFLKGELIPHIDSEYRTMPYRVFVGHSFGGITTLNALYTIPETFNAYVAIDPSLWWDNRVLLLKARDYFGTARLEGRALYVAQANTINPADTARNLHFESITQFNEVMRAYDQSGIRYGFRYYDRDDHGSVPVIAEYDALRFLFDGYGAPLQQIIEEPAQLTEHFRKVSEGMGADFQPSEAMIRLLSQVTLARDTAKAIEFGELRTELYPESFRAWEFLGDVWAAKGDAAKARGYYEQALEKGADPAAIREKLDKLGG